MKTIIGISKVEVQPKCFHCGDSCSPVDIRFDEKDFCCEGCKLVYELLREKDLCTYYSIDKTPGISHPGYEKQQRFDYLDDEQAGACLIRFRNQEEAHVTFYIPGMHCSSCIWLLENLNRLDTGVFSATVDFPRKEVNVVYHPGKIKLSGLAALLSRIGYPPSVSLSDIEKRSEKKSSRTQVIRIGLAGFCFGNIMMLSFPEYLGLGHLNGEKKLGAFFSGLNLILSLPVIAYCASGFFISAWKGIREKFLNIDAPIALAILVTFMRSVYEILSGSGAGYLDSMSGIVFFMLLGRYFQNRTFDNLSFDRDYKSYFPLGTSVLGEDGTESRKLVCKLEKGERIRVRNNELVPADAILMSLSAHFDYSFITGESGPVRKVAGELIYAGARQLDGAVDLEVVQATSQSYLTQLWNRDHVQDRSGKKSALTIVDITNRYFTLAVIAIAIIASLYWGYQGFDKSVNAFTAVLIVACPCGLLLTSVFANGNIMRVMGRNGLYLKNSDVIEKLADTSAIVFDKTGTITHGSSVVFMGNCLNELEMELVVSLAAQSSHPLSRRLCEEYAYVKQHTVYHFREDAGRGISGSVCGHKVRLGSLSYVGFPGSSGQKGSCVYPCIDGKVKGHFNFGNMYRPGLKELVKELHGHDLSVLSGDNDSEYSNLKTLFGSGCQLFFEQKPEDKQQYVQMLQAEGKKVMMLGDGLNDAGALRQSDVGIAVTDDTSNFSPACEGILDGKSLPKLKSLIDLAKANKKIILLTFILSLVYNLAGLTYAVRGELSPLVAAILMPLSSVSIVVLASSCTSLAAKIKGL